MSVIMMENTNWSSIAGNTSQAPYLNSLISGSNNAQTSYATQYYTPPNNHPSLPNYLWLEAGTNCFSDTGCITDDNPPSSHSTNSTAHLVTLLKNAGISWKAYEESAPSTTCPLTDSYPYAVKHDPFMYFNDVTGTQNPSNSSCIAHVQPYTTLASDLTNNTVARYNFITPNLCNDMHDSCSPTNDPIKQGDTWLSNQIPIIENSQAYKTGGAISIVWDEGGNSSDGPIGMIALSPSAKGNGYHNAIHYTHSSTLRTMEEIFGVSPLLGDAQNASDLSDLFAAGAIGGGAATATPTSTGTPPATPTNTPVPTPTGTGTSTIPGSPPNTSSNVHLAMGAIGGVSSCCNALLTTNAPMENVWDWNNGTASSYPTIFKGYYFPADRQPSTQYTSTAEPLSWFQTNHPDWIEYQCDRTTTAYEFGDTTYIPLDVSNPAVLAWEEQNFWGPIAASGNYQELSFDNFQFDNSGSWSGQRCGHYDTNGSWVQQYSGTSNDSNYRQFEITLAQNLQSWLHANNPNVAFSPNFSYADSYPAQSDSLMATADILLDEQGWTNGNSAPPWQYLDTAWIDKAQHLSSFLATGKGWIDQNHEPVNGTSTTTAQRQWAIGNYLMFKNSTSWMFIDGTTDAGQLVNLPEYAAAQVGTPTNTYYANQGVYRRDFTGGLVFVNPSSATSYTVTIPANTYKDLYGTVQGGSVTLSSGTAIVLVHL